MQGRQNRLNNEATTSHQPGPTSDVPGKRTLTEALGSGAPGAMPVRAQALEPGGAAVPANVGGSLPGLPKLQTLFGHHDLSSVRYVGGGRGAAVADAAGTTALATGGLVVSGSDSPGVVAHEAAHVVLQRGGVTGGPDAERRADAVAAGVEGGQNVQAMLDEVAAPGAANAPMRSVDPMKKKGAPVDVSTLSPRAVLMALDTVSRYGEPSMAGDTEYEHGDTAALEARRTASGFGATESHDLNDLLTHGNAGVEAVAANRHLAVSLPGFQAIYQQLRSDKRVVGLDEWVIMNSVYLDMIHRGTPEEARNGAEQLLDALNELRSLKTMLARLGPTDTLDAREAAIAGTTQTADGTARNDAGDVTAQLEVKTVRTPIGYNQLADVKSQLGAGLTKFASAGPGNYEVHVFASYTEDLPKTTKMGPFTRTETVNRDEHSFDRTSTKPHYDLRTMVADELVAYLNTNHRANPTGRVSLIIENSTRGQETLTFLHAHVGAAWKQ